MQSLASPLSVELWFWAFAALSTQRLLFAWDATPGASVQMYYNTDNTVQVEVNGVFPAKSAVLATQAWHQLVLTWDNVTIRQYVDGALSQSAASAGPATVSRQLGIGANPVGAATAFEGFLSECSVYSTALSLPRIAAHYAAVDQLAQVPTFITGLGTSSLSSTSSQTTPPGLADVLHAVQRTFPTT